MGNVLHTLMIHLGFTMPPSGPGYRWAGSWAVRYQVCDRCGARVGAAEESQHDAWHAQLGR